MPVELLQARELVAAFKNPGRDAQKRVIVTSFDFEEEARSLVLSNGVAIVRFENLVDEVTRYYA